MWNTVTPARPMRAADYPAGKTEIDTCSGKSEGDTEKATPKNLRWLLL